MLPNGVSWKSTAICGIVQEALRRAQLNHSAHDYWMRNAPRILIVLRKPTEHAPGWLEDRAFQVARDGVAKWCCTRASR